MVEFIVQRITSATDLPDDQVRCVLLMFMGFPLGLLFRHVLHPSHTSLTTRHLFSSLTGLTLTTLCFGWYTLLPLVTAAVSYILLLAVSPKSVQRYTMVWVMGCLSVTHLYRTMTDPAGQRLDLSGPMMIIIQKLSFVAFAVHDGMGGNRSPLSEDQRRQKLTSVPSVLEYMSYCFNFHSVLAGPAVTMREYLSFMDGSNFRVTLNTANSNGHTPLKKEPSSLYPVISKLAIAVSSSILYIFLIDYNRPILIDPSMNILQKIIYFQVSCLCIRCRFYFIFVLNDSISNAAGLGFEGYDSLNRPKWGLATNVNIKNMELSTSMRQTINNWNITSSRWIRRVCYERVSWQPTLMSFMLSAVWHGFYPGYYLCFVNSTISLVAARKMRQLYNPFFTSHGPILKWCYHLATWATTHICIGYCCLAIILLWPSDVLLLWRYHYFIPTVIPLLVLLLLPSGKTHRHKTVSRKEDGVADNSKKQD